MKTRPEQRGSVLILSLWALLLLSAAIFGWVKFIGQNIDITTDRNNGLEAKALAHSGVMVALNPAVSPRTPLLNQQLNAQRSYRVRITGEGGRLDLNWLFAPAENADPARIALFQRYLERRGLNLQQRSRLVDCILDWLDLDNIPRLNGAEDDGDYHPPNRDQFLSVEELAMVKGSAPLVSQPGWQDDFTIYTKNGPSHGAVDLQSASLLILASLPGVGEVNAARFIKFRQGPDGLDGTQDDHLFKSVQEALSYLGLNTQQQQALAAYVTVENPFTTQQPTVRIVSTGQCGNVTRRTEVIATKNAAQPKIWAWKEQ